MKEKFNTQVKEGKATLTIEQTVPTVICKQCKDEYILYRFMRDEENNKVLWIMGTWDYCPSCGVKNENPRGM